MGGSEAARKRRIRRVLELSTAGMTIPDISAILKREGYAWSERTVWGDQHSVEAKAFQEELLRKQLTDITVAPIGLRLRYRSELLKRMMPQKIETKQDITTRSKGFTVVIADVGASTWEEVKAEQAAAALEKENESNNPPTP